MVVAPLHHVLKTSCTCKLRRHVRGSDEGRAFVRCPPRNQLTISLSRATLVNKNKFRISAPGLEVSRFRAGVTNAASSRACNSWHSA